MQQSIKQLRALKWSHHLDCVRNKLLCILKLPCKRHNDGTLHYAWVKTTMQWYLLPGFGKFICIYYGSYSQMEVSIPQCLTSWRPCNLSAENQFKMVLSQVFLYARVHSNFLFKLEIVHLLLTCNHPLHTEDMWTQKVMERSYAFLIVIGTSHLWKSDCGRWTLFVKIILLLVIIMAIWKHQLYPL